VINIKKIIILILLSLISLKTSNAAIKDSLFATVGNKAITKNDIVTEVKTILILSGQDFSEDKRDELQTAAIKSIIKRNIKLIEIEKYNTLKFNLPDVEKEVARLASNVNMDVDTLKNTFVTNGINFSNIIERIQVELLWNSLIFELYKDRLIVNKNEIEDQLKQFQNKKEVEEYLISEIIIKPVMAEQLDEEIDKIKKKISIDGFEKTAVNLSISESALRGGNLGWINENVIPEKFRSKIINTQVGKMSEAIILPEGILFFKVRDKRKIDKLKTLEEVKNQLVNAEKTKILNMHSLSHYDKLKRSVTINYIK